MYIQGVVTASYFDTFIHTFIFGSPAQCRQATDSMSPPPPAALALPDSHVTTKTLALFAAGLLSAFAAYSVLSHVRDTQTKTKSCRDPFSGNPKLLEDNKYLPDIIKACQPHQRSETRLKGVTTLQLLSRNENNKKILVDAGALEVLVNLLRATDIRETAQKYAAVAICDLVQSVDERKVRIVQAGVLDPLKRVLTSDVVHNNELKYWSLMVVHQISLCDSLHHSLITDGFVPLLARMSRLTFGNTNMPKYCMQSLVRIVATTDTAEAKDLLTELLNHNIVSLISVCLRSDDVELIYWASGLMHEYVLKDVSPRLFRQIKGVQTILLTLLGADETYISRVVLRTVKFMAHGQVN
ncbi:armadillo-type protein [Jimgerdemannia flammicorona]|uniref:Armadillo-type protein n=1 Tax=Jimgerdemannia flammicorona TaxID=994334 RepID=A0A433Q9G9_9FUNG|nr:armadillo-type protein [Jimgerdemannia flammicorona]